MIAAIAVAGALTAAPAAWTGPERWASDSLDVLGVPPDPTSRANFAAHVGWSLAVPLAGRALGGRSGALWAGAGWLVWSAASLALFHRGARWPEIRSGLISRFVPCAAVMVFHL